MWKNQEWLDSGGAEIVLEVVRRMGWTVEVRDAETWEFLPDIVSFGNRDDCLISVNGAMPLWLQAVAVVATSHSIFKKLPGSSYMDGNLPFFHYGELLDKLTVHQIDRFIDGVRFTHEATLAVMGKPVHN